jgi:hypothetical protein
MATKLSRFPRRSFPAWVRLPAITSPSLEVGDVVQFTPGVAIGLPYPVVTTTILVDGVSKGAGPYEIAPEDAGKAVTIRSIASNGSGSRTSVSDAVTVDGGVAPGTWQGMRMLGGNMPLLSDYDKSHPFVDLMATAREWRTYDDPWTEGHTATLNAGQHPNEDCSVVLLANGITQETGQYLCGFSGQATPEVYAMTGSISNLSTSGGVTTFTLNATLNGNTATLIVLRFSNVGSDFGLTTPFYCLRPGVPRNAGHEWGAAWDAHLQGLGRLRFMNWLETNNSTETGVAGALAFNTQANRKGARLSTQLALCNRLSMHGWWNTPALANSALRQAYVSAIHGTLNPGLTGLLEHSNEPWNSMFQAYTQGMTATKARCGTRSGNQITSITRVGNTVTALLAQAHGKAVGSQIGVAGLYSNNGEWPAELVTLISGTSGSTLVWTSSASGNDTATIVGQSTIHLTPSDVLCAPTATLPVPNVYEAKENWDVEQARANFTAIAAVSGASDRLKPAIGLQLSTIGRVERMMAWCAETYGSASWLVWTAAYYATPAEGTQDDLTTEALVRASLEEARQLARVNLWRFKSISGGFNAPIALYEMGPHNDSKYPATKDAVAAVHASDWMRTFVRQMLQDVRDVVGCEASYFNMGATDTYNTTTNNTWPVAMPIIGAHTTSPKWQAMSETLPLDFAPQPINGLNWGTLSWITAVPWVFYSGAGNLILLVNERAHELSQSVVPPSGAGSYPLTIRACTNWGDDLITVLVNGAPVATNVAMPIGNPYAEAAGTAWFGTVPLNDGFNLITVRVSRTRGAQVGLGPLTIGT